MKKIIILLFIMLCGTVCAQTYDTVSGRNGYSLNIIIQRVGLTPAMSIIEPRTLQSVFLTTLKSGVFNCSW